MGRRLGRCFVGDPPLHGEHVRLARRPGFRGRRRFLFAGRLRRDGCRLGPLSLDGRRAGLGMSWRLSRHFFDRLALHGRRARRLYAGHGRRLGLGLGRGRRFFGWLRLGGTHFRRRRETRQLGLDRRWLPGRCGSRLALHHGHFKPGWRGDSRRRRLFRLGRLNWSRQHFGCLALHSRRGYFPAGGRAGRLYTGRGQSRRRLFLMGNGRAGFRLALHRGRFWPGRRCCAAGCRGQWAGLRWRRHFFC
jgi:hypothetical protein